MATSQVANQFSGIPSESFPISLVELPWSPAPVQAAQPEKIKPVADVVEAEMAATRERLLMEHLPLVRFVAYRVHKGLPQHVELDDLIGAGMLGLIDAVEKFNAGKNVRFRSYAQFRIRGAILDSLRSLDWGSRELRRKGREIEEIVERLQARLNRQPAETEIAGELGISLGEYQELLGTLKGLEIGSLHETRTEDSLEEELAYVPASPEENPLAIYLEQESSAGLRAAMAQLPEREARVLELYYLEEMTLKEIGRVLELVESRVSQIRASAIINLRLYLNRTRREDQRRTARSRAQAQIPAEIVARSQDRPMVGRLAAR